MEEITTHQDVDYYRKRQEFLNATYSQRVLEWLHFFGINTSDRVLHIIQGPPESHLFWRKGKIATHTRWFGVGAKIKFALDGNIGTSPSYKPSSKKTLIYKTDGTKDGFKKFL